MADSEAAYDVVVIGAGAVGENVADRAVAGGMRTVIVESELVGGECSYWACMPSKALLRSGSALRAAQRVGGAKEATSGQLDVEAVLQRRDTAASNWDDGSQVDWLNGAGIDLIRGHGRLVGHKQIEVAADDGSVITLTARHAVALCTGSVPIMPNIPGLSEIDPWSSKDATSAKHVPGSLAIIGGGVVAVEMATAYLGFGTRVQVVARSTLLPGDEPFAGKLVLESLERLGASVRLHASVVSAHRTESEYFNLILDDDSRVVADKVLVATGRAPRSGDLGLESVGLAAGGWVDVDDTMRVRDVQGASVDWLYAVGDINHRALLTHQGKYQARAAGDAIAARARGETISVEPWSAYVATADHGAVPQVTFTDPEVASVGLTAEAAAKAGYRTRVVDCPFSSVAAASIVADGYQGEARIVVDEDRQVLLGATFVGQDVGELLHSATVAIVGEVPIARLWHAVPPYPTLSEVWLRLLEAYGRDSA